MSPQTAENVAPTNHKDAKWFCQFSRPAGWRGWLVGHIMAIKNRKRSLWVLSLLELGPSDRVLELGFGPGADIQRVAARIPHGFVAGVDHSEEMARQAVARNARAIRAGLVRLQQASASSLPWEADSFDTVFSINVAQFWHEPVEVAREIHRVLRPGGRVALAVQPRSKGATEATAIETGVRLSHALGAAGFAQVRVERKRLRPVSVVCALGTK